MQVQVRSPGMPDVQMTSLATEAPAGARIDPASFRKRMAHEFCAAHGRELHAVQAWRLHAPRLRGRMPRARPRGKAGARADATQKTTPIAHRATAVSGSERP